MTLCFGMVVKGILVGIVDLAVYLHEDKLMYLCSIHCCITPVICTEFPVGYGEQVPWIRRTSALDVLTVLTHFI